MPRFYFDFEIGENSYSDGQGVELESLEVARRVTTRVLPTLLHQELANAAFQEVHLKIRDEKGGVIWIENIARKDFDPSNVNVERLEICSSRGH